MEYNGEEISDQEWSSSEMQDYERPVEHKNKKPDIDRVIDRITEAHRLAFVEDEWVILRDKKRIKDILTAFVASIKDGE